MVTSSPCHRGPKGSMESLGKQYQADVYPSKEPEVVNRCVDPSPYSVIGGRMYNRQRLIL